MCRELAGGITNEMVTEINKILENESPARLIEGLETFIAVLRNSATASNIDV